MIPTSGAVLAVEHDEAPNRSSRPFPFHQIGPKIAYMTNGAKNHPHDETRNRLQDAVGNRPDIIKPVSLVGVIDEASLKALLKSKGQPRWCSRVRLRGLLLLINHICRNLKNNGTITISADLRIRSSRRSERRTARPLLLSPFSCFAYLASCKR
jgi:hypothetical protein